NRASPTPLVERTHVIRHKHTSDHGDTAMAWYDRGEGYQSGMELLGHAGGTGGYETFIGINKDQRRGVVVLSSRQGGLSPETIGLLLLKGVRLSGKLQSACRPAPTRSVSESRWISTPRRARSES